MKINQNLINFNLDLRNKDIRLPSSHSDRATGFFVKHWWHLYFSPICQRTWAAYRIHPVFSIMNGSRLSQVNVSLEAPKATPESGDHMVLPARLQVKWWDGNRYVRSPEQSFGTHQQHRRDGSQQKVESKQELLCAGRTTIWWCNIRKKPRVPKCTTEKTFLL